MTENWYTEIFELADRDFAIRFSKFKIAAKSSREDSILFKISIQSFTRSLIRIFLLYFRNSKGWIQYGNEKKEKSINCVQNWHIWIFEVPDHDFDISLSKYKVAVKSSNEALFLLKICIKGLFEAYNQDFAFGLLKFKMVNPNVI